jgi:hypothetical protein
MTVGLNPYLGFKSVRLIGEVRGVCSTDVVCIFYLYIVKLDHVALPSYFVLTGILD